MAKAMIITVGTGPTVAHGICFSIKQQNPDFIVFLVTRESEEKTLPAIVQDEVMRERQYKKMPISNPNDVERIANEVADLICSIRYNPKDIVIDYTSGTKAMSAGVTIAGIRQRVGALAYITGDRNSRGIVISGTEKVISLEPNRIYADDLWTKAVASFNNFQYDTCRRLVQEAGSLLADERFHQKLSALKLLSEGYSYWDRFKLDKAFKRLKSLKKSDELLRIWGINEQIEKNKKALYQEKEKIFCKERVVDLIENAKRRALEGKFDDAMARLYRTIEYIAQYKVNEKGLFKKDKKDRPQTDNLDVQAISSDKLRKKYEQYRDPKDGKIGLSLYKLYELLKDLGEDIGEFFFKEWDEKNGKLKKLLGLRNKSILAHGFNPIGEAEFNEGLSVVQELARFIIQDLDFWGDKVKFPKISDKGS